MKSGLIEVEIAVDSGAMSRGAVRGDPEPGSGGVGVGVAVGVDVGVEVGVAVGAEVEVGVGTLKSVRDTGASGVD
ncbi:MAG TPA: hypothetical protein VLC06_24710 [Polyangia bacterium]|nr:hypothetical protein [Polyangia bacterium]